MYSYRRSKIYQMARRGRRSFSLEFLNFEHNAAAAKRIAEVYDTPPLAYVHSYGCQQNVSDGERIRGVLADIGYGLCDKPEDADLILFNTCAVREHAEQRVFGNVGALKALKEKKHGLIIGLCGCMANQQHIVDKLRKSYPYVDLVFGVDGIDTLPQLLEEKLEGKKRILMDPAQRPAIVEHIPVRRESDFRAWLPIMYGCDNFCTYCIVPYVRGREKSRRPADILEEFRGLVAAGYKEITLLGQNVNSYGKGLEEKVDFSDLLNLLCAVPGDYRVRFMTSHPKDASRKLIDTIAAQPHLCKHLHLPVQCGSDRLLAEMNRHYTVEQYLSLIDYARERVPGITFSSDIIVGFPGETEEDFAGTLALIEKVGYMQLFTFIYSKRTGTKAALLPDPTPRREKTDRMQRLLDTQDAIAMRLAAGLVGQTARVLVEGYGREPGTLSGRLDNNLTVEFPAQESLIGSYKDVSITGTRATVLLGEQNV
jgi:tRNA-N(6)-(isopentenyl)adenosine-37 thiotransferase enzyme MiaB